jgi:Fe-S cluster assembly protein SufD
MTYSLDHYRAEYEQASRKRSDSEPAWLARTRQQALDRFLSLGFPTTRDEEWRFTSVAPLAEVAFALATDLPTGSIEEAVARFRLPLTAAAELVFVNGLFVPALSHVGTLPHGASVEDLPTALTTTARHPVVTRLATIEQHAFTALNTAFFSAGAYIRISAGSVVTEPIHVLYLSAGESGRPVMSHPRVGIAVGEQAQACVVETYAGAGGGRYFTNGVTEISLAEHAVLDHYKLQYESEQAYHIGSMHVRADHAAHFTSHSISLGGSLVRNDVIAALAGEGVDCTLNGLYLADGQRHVDNHTTIDHARAHCGSREVYKGILADRARGVFNGKIIVRPDAQKSDAKQTNRALLLSEDAQINTKPQLEIFANDVKCTHGAAVGQLDEEAIFYLRSRGLAERDAKRLLTYAFAAEVLQRIPLQPIRARVDEIVGRALTARLAAA